MSATLTAAPSPEVQPDIDYQPLLDIPFWRLENYKPVVPEEPDPKHRPIPAEPVVWRNRPTAPPAIRLLAPWRELQPRLRAALAEPREGREIDVNLIVCRLSCGQWLDRLPHERHRRWGPCLQLVIDRSEHLAPYWTDQDQVRGELARLFAAQDLEQAVFHEGLDEPRLLGASASGGYRAPPGGVVLVLGDLGGLTARAADEGNPWLALGRRIAAAGGRPVALLPCPPERCPAALRRLWQLIPWERPRRYAVTDRHILRERTERLLRLVSPAVRIEPGFLRAVRLSLSLGADEADAGAEADVWQHPAIASTHSDAATLDPKYAKELRAAFAAEPTDRQQQVLALLRVWRGHLPQEIWFEEIRDLARASLEALPDAADLEDARRFFDSIGDRLEPTPDGPSDVAVGAWMGRVRARATDDFWTIDNVGTRLLRIDWLRNRRRPDYRPPVPCDPAELPPPPGQAEQRYELRQEGDDLALFPAPPTAVSATGAGSYLGALRTVNQLVQIFRTAPADPDRNAFWRSGQPPRWADAWGTDEYGHWVTFSINNKQGQKITQRMRWIEPGTFLMGSPEDEPERWDHEGPQHTVTISQGFWLFEAACTQELWEAVMSHNPSGFKGAKRPVENVSWNDCQTFLQRLNKNLPGLDLALPSEAQWEYACRAGTTTPFSFGANITPEQVNYDGNNPYAGGEKGLNRQETVPVASLPPNPWGLYEMHGNVWEWCQDWYGVYREKDPMVDPLGPPTGERRVMRGGSWKADGRVVRSAYRNRAVPNRLDPRISFRCARVRVASPAGPEGAEPAGPARGRQAERRPEQVPPSGATGAQPTLLRLDAVPPQDRCALPQVPAFLIHTDRERLTFCSLTKPEWASAIGRDRFGLWCEIVVEPKQGEPVIQRLRWIPPGRFWMGSPEEETRGLAKDDDERKWFKREHPRHLVTLTEGYWLFDTPCTQALWEAVMGANWSRFQSPTRPVEQVSWHDVQDFLRQLNERIPDLDLALPSEAQWEYACRAGTETAIYTGELAILGQCNAPALDPIAWYGGNSGVDFNEVDLSEDSSSWLEKQYPHTEAGTNPVKLKQANPWGLYDMLGNVFEWCQDGMRNYDVDAQTNPTGLLDAGAGRIVRGGSWYDVAHRVRSASRFALHPDFRNDYIGFRCARVRGDEPMP